MAVLLILQTGTNPMVLCRRLDKLWDSHAMKYCSAMKIENHQDIDEFHRQCGHRNITLQIAFIETVEVSKNKMWDQSTEQGLQGRQGSE
jgi:hypothetical protein